jgi:MFS family permease
MTARIFQGAGSAVWWGMGPAVVADCFFYHERGFWMGMYILASYLGINVGPLCAGFVVDSLGWRWTMWLTAILTGVILVFMLLVYPETLYINRHLPQSQRSIARTSYWQSMRPQLMPPNIRHGVHVYQLWLQPFRMLRYPSVTLPGLYWGFHYMWKIGIGTTIPEFFTPVYKFTPAQTGLVYIGFIIGCIVGEIFAGRFSDAIVKRTARKNNGFYKQESRLGGLYLGAVVCPAGLVMLGTSLHYKSPWIVPVVALGVYNFGLEIIGTIVNTYQVDCLSILYSRLSSDATDNAIGYKAQAPEIGVVNTIFRNMCLGFFVTFFLPPFIALDGILWTFCIPAICLWVCFPLLILPLVLHGEKWRLHLGQPGLKEA